MLLIDRDATLDAIPNLLPADQEERRKGFAALRQVLSASGQPDGEAAERLRQIERLFGIDAGRRVSQGAPLGRRPNTTLADFERRRDSRISFFVTHG